MKFSLVCLVVAVLWWDCCDFVWRVLFDLGVALLPIFVHEGAIVWYGAVVCPLGAVFVDDQTRGSMLLGMAIVAVTICLRQVPVRTEFALVRKARVRIVPVGTKRKRVVSYRDGYIPFFDRPAPYRWC